MAEKFFKTRRRIRRAPKNLPAGRATASVTGATFNVVALARPRGRDRMRRHGDHDRPVKIRLLERGKPLTSLNHGILEARFIVEFLKHTDRYTPAAEVTFEFSGKSCTPDVVLFPVVTTDWMHDEVRVTEAPVLAAGIGSLPETPRGAACHRLSFRLLR